MEPSKAEPRKNARDLLEYILLISFVTFGSSFVFASEIKAASQTRKSPSSSMENTPLKGRPRNALFGLSTKRHIK